MPREWSLSEVHDIVSSAIPERVMIVWRDRRLTFGEIAGRSGALARSLVAQHLGVHRERGELARWECGQDRVALLMHNTPEHVESILACWKARVVPCNVNYHYTPREIADLLERIGARGVIYERSLAEKLAEISPAPSVMIEIDDVTEGEGGTSIPGAVPYPRAIELGEAGGVGGELPAPRPTTCTSPAPAVRPVTRRRCCGARPTCSWPGWAGATISTRKPSAPGRSRAPESGFPARRSCTSCRSGRRSWPRTWAATVVLHDDSQPFDARTILETAARERVNMMTIVGDVYACPMIEELRRAPYDLSALWCSAPVGRPRPVTRKNALMELVPSVSVRDGYGASEIGAMASGESARDEHGVQHFSLSPAARLLSADRTHFLDPGDDEIGWLARCGHVPLGYLNDRARDACDVPRGRRLATRDFRRPRPLRRRRSGRPARTRLARRQHRRREGVRRGGRGRPQATRRRRRCHRRRPAERPVRSGSGGDRPAHAIERGRPGRTARMVRGAARPLQGAPRVRVRGTRRAVPEWQGELPVGPIRERRGRRRPLTGTSVQIQLEHGEVLLVAVERPGLRRVADTTAACTVHTLAARFQASAAGLPAHGSDGFRPPTLCTTVMTS